MTMPKVIVATKTLILLPFFYITLKIDKNKKDEVIRLLQEEELACESVHYDPSKVETVSRL